MCMMSLTPRPTPPHRVITTFRWTAPGETVESPFPRIVREPVPDGNFAEITAPVTFRDFRGAALRKFDKYRDFAIACNAIEKRAVTVRTNQGLAMNPRLVRALTGRDGFGVALLLLEAMEHSPEFARAGEDQGVGIEQLKEMIEYARSGD